MIRTKRVYEPSSKDDGKRFLVERLWPRGVKKQALHMEAWVKDAAPSHALRRWFNHDAAKWLEFQRRYRKELGQRPESCRSLLDAADRGDVTLLFSSHDTEHNNALALKQYLDERSLGNGTRRRASTKT